MSTMFSQSHSLLHEKYASPHRTTKRFQRQPCPPSIIFDLGDVLFTWSAASPRSPVPPKVMKAILRSATWYEYERGNLGETEVYTAIGNEFGISAGDVASAFVAARDSLQSNPLLLEAIRLFKATGVKIYAMSNISAPDWEVLKTKASEEEWALFDKVFTSAAAGARKPDLGFYQYVIDESGVNPACTIFVDDKLENVISARSLGMQGIVFDNVDNVIRQLKIYVENPVERAQSFLGGHKQRLLSYTSTGVEIKENFAQLLILEATGDPSLVNYIHHEGQWNFFQGKGHLTTEHFPNDLDTTSMGLLISPDIPESVKNEVMDQMLQCKNKDGIVQTYFVNNRPRIDPVVCVNVLTLFYRNGRGHQLSKTLEWVKNVLIHRAYLAGTYYYATAECFLYFLSKLLRVSPEVSRALGPSFRRAIQERFGTPGDALALSMRILAAAHVGIVDEIDLPVLLSLQEVDGRFTGYFYKYGASGIPIANDGVTTALAIRAIEAIKNLHRFPRKAALVIREV